MNVSLIRDALLFHVAWLISYHVCGTIYSCAAIKRYGYNREICIQEGASGILLYTYQGNGGSVMEARSMVSRDTETQEHALPVWNEQMQRAKEYRHHKVLRRLRDKVILMIAGKEKRGAFSSKELVWLEECVLRCTPMLVFEDTEDWEWCYCPNCYAILDREYMRCCDCCGQRLSWHGTRKYAVRISHSEAMRRKARVERVQNAPCPAPVGAIVPCIKINRISQPL